MSQHRDKEEAAKEEAEDSDEEGVDYRQTLGKLKHQALINNKSHKSKAHMEKAIEKLKKVRLHSSSHGVSRC